MVLIAGARARRLRRRCDDGGSAAAPGGLQDPRRRRLDAGLPGGLGGLRGRRQPARPGPEGHRRPGAAGGRGARRQAAAVRRSRSTPSSPTRRCAAATGRSPATRSSSSTAPTQARVIEADYIEKTGGGTTPVQARSTARAHQGRRPAGLPDARAAGGLRPRAVERGPRHDPAEMTARGVIGGLLGFTLAGVVLAAVLGRVLPDDWSTGVFVAVGLAAAVAAGAAGGVGGRWQGTPGAAILGAAARRAAADRAAAAGRPRHRAERARRARGGRRRGRSRRWGARAEIPARQDGPGPDVQVGTRASCVAASGAAPCALDAARASFPCRSDGRRVHGRAAAGRRDRRAGSSSTDIGDADRPTSVKDDRLPDHRRRVRRRGAAGALAVRHLRGHRQVHGQRRGQPPRSSRSKPSVGSSTCARSVPTATWR